MARLYLLAVTLNVWVLVGILAAAFAVQFWSGEPPCPLCVTQRIALGSFVGVETSRASLAGISAPGVSRSDEDLSKLIRNRPSSRFVLMSHIVKRMNQRQRPEFSARRRR